MRKLSLVLSLVLLPLSTLPAFADGVVIIGTGVSNGSSFGNPGATAQVGYTINISDNGSSLIATFTTTQPNSPSSGGLSFANGYFDTVANNGMGSNLGFEFTNGRAFIPGVSTGGQDGHGYYYLAGTGYSFTDTFDALNDETIQAIIPNSFFLSDPLGMGFTTTPNGTAVSLHLTQAFSYDVVGGSANFPAPKELGEATVSAAAATTPEPSSLILLGTGVLGMAGAVRRRYLTR